MTPASVGRLELLAKRIWREEIDESPTRRLMGDGAKVRFDPQSCKVHGHCDGQDFEDMTEHSERNLVRSIH
jgi:hypothetical protein